MKDIYKNPDIKNGFAVPFALAQSSQQQSGKNRSQLSGFAKVLAGGRVVSLNKHKPFADRMLADGVANCLDANHNDVSIEQIILESVATNLEAGVKLIDKQEFALAQMGGRLSEMALLLNQARCSSDFQDVAQSKFEESRTTFRSIAKTTFDHTALFSVGPAKPVTVIVPAKNHWEGLSIDRCNLKKPGLSAIEVGKVSPSANGLLLDPQSFSAAFEEWRMLCAVNRLQWHLLYQRWQGIVRTLRDFIGGRRWTPPPFPSDDAPGPVKRPNLLN